MGYASTEPPIIWYTYFVPNPKIINDCMGTVQPDAVVCARRVGQPELPGQVVKIRNDKVRGAKPSELALKT